MWVVHFTILSTFFRLKKFQNQKEIQFQHFCWQHPKGPMTGSSCAAPFQGAMIIKRLCGLSCSILHPLREDCIPLPPVLSPSKAAWTCWSCVTHWPMERKASYRTLAKQTGCRWWAVKSFVVRILPCSGFKTWSQNSLALVPLRDGGLSPSP